jgi:hypothetical protein
MTRRVAALLLLALAALALALPGGAAAEVKCPNGSEVQYRAECFGLETLSASLSDRRAGAHPDLTYTFSVVSDPETEPDDKGLHDSYAPIRNLRVDLPPGLLANPNILGPSQQCRVIELASAHCPNGSQIGIAEVNAYTYGILREPIFMMRPPGGDVVARVGFIAALYPIFTDVTVRTDGDFGASAEIADAPSEANLVRAEATLWGVPADPKHDKERCNPEEVFLHQCVESPPRPPGTSETAFTTNPTRCGVPLSLKVSAQSWAEPEYDPKNTLTALFASITECEGLPFGPGLSVQPTNHRAASPTGLDMTLTQPEAEGVKVREPSQIRDIRIQLPQGIAPNPASADGLGTCSAEQVKYKERVAAQCPDNSKLASTEFEVGGLPRRMKGAIYLQQPEPGNLFRVWVVADDLGAHVKLQGQLQLDESTGQVTSVLLDNPQAPLREVRVRVTSGLRAPLMTPSSCGTYDTHYEFTPWAGGPSAINETPMAIDEGCDTGGFDPKLSAGATDASAGAHTQFSLTLTREDGEDNLGSLEVTLPRGLSATFAGIPHCEGAAAESGQCPPESRIGKVSASTGVGPAPLWVPQPGKDPTAVYLGGPYKGAPLSIVTVVPAQAGPFDLGDQVVRSAVYVDPVTAEATTKTDDPLPQMLEGVPVLYRTVNVLLDRPDFTLNPTSCAKKQTTSLLHSAGGQAATPSSSFAAANCERLPFKPKLSLRLNGGTHRGAHPKLRAVLRMPSGGANIARTSVALPHSEFLDQAHIRTVCTRVQFAARQCPPGSVYGHVKAITPLLDEPIEGNVYLRSSSHPLPDMVFALKGPPSLPIEIDAVSRIDSVNGGIRSTFDSVPDAPVSKLIASFPGGKKGLIVNSTSLCAQKHRATVKLNAHNGKRKTLHPVLRSKCPKAKRRSGHRRG